MLLSRTHPPQVGYSFKYSSKGVAQMNPHAKSMVIRDLCEKAVETDVDQVRRENEPYANCLQYTMSVKQEENACGKCKIMHCPILGHSMMKWALR
jgi:hypothetical protein